MNNNNESMAAAEQTKNSAIILDLIKDAVATYKMREKDADAITDFVNDCADEIDAVNDADELGEVFNDWNSCQDVIYYYSACNVIKDFVDSHNDYSLYDVREALMEYGYYELNNLNSVDIATVLNQKTNADAFSELMELIEDAELFPDGDGE